MVPLWRTGRDGGGSVNPHPFRPHRPGSPVCGTCGNVDGHSLHILPLPGLEDADKARTEARSMAEAYDLTQRMSEPGRDISRTSGEMERNSPLFFGTGDNPTLF